MRVSPVHRHNPRSVHTHHAATHAPLATARARTTLAREAKNESAQWVFDTMPVCFLPNKAKGVNVCIQFNLSGPGGGNWNVTIKDGKINVQKGKAARPTTTINSDAQYYIKLADGEVNPVWAYLRGKIKISGDIMIMKKWDSLFDFSKDDGQPYKPS